MRTLAVLVAIAALGAIAAGSFGAIYATAHTHDLADAFEIALLE